MPELAKTTYPSPLGSYVIQRKHLFTLKATDALKYKARDNTDRITQTSKLIYTAILSRSDSLIAEEHCPSVKQGPWQGCRGNGSRWRMSWCSMFPLHPLLPEPRALPRDRDGGGKQRRHVPRSFPAHAGLRMNQEWRCK